MGAAGVSRCLEIMHKELDVSMALCGKTDVRALDRNTLLAHTLPRG